MGNWNISIRGVGAHHNENNPKDVDRIARRFVRELREAGHSILDAEITHGSAEALAPKNEHWGLGFNPDKLDDQGRDANGMDRKGQVG